MKQQTLSSFADAATCAVIHHLSNYLHYIKFHKDTCRCSSALSLIHELSEQHTHFFLWGTIKQNLCEVEACKIRIIFCYYLLFCLLPPFFLFLCVPALKALLGNRYGHRALPRLMPEKQFEALMSKLSKNPEGIKQLNQWFLKDDNSVPPAYILQPITAHFPHYSDLRPESGPQHDNNVLAWRFTETRLLQLLRSAATDAEADGDITAEQKQHFYTSGQ